jgi:hypothetical protein
MIISRLCSATSQTVVPSMIALSSALDRMIRQDSGTLSKIFMMKVMPSSVGSV